MKTIRDEIRDGSASKIEALTAKATLPKKTWYSSGEMFKNLDARVRLTNFKKGVEYAVSRVSPTAVAVEADDLKRLMEWAQHDMDTFAYDRLERECFAGIAAKYSEVEG